jgi:hypothetical protein
MAATNVRFSGCLGHGFASLTFFYFRARRYSGASCSQVRLKLAAGRELSHGLIHVASEFRLAGEALFAVG